MDFLKQLMGRLGEDDSAGLAAEMSYNWMLALLPTLIFIFTLFGMFGIHTDLFAQILGNLQRLIPNDAFDLIQASLSELTRDSSGSLALVSFLGALWTASNGAITVEKALNRANHCIEIKRTFWQQRIIALLIVIGLAILLFVCANLIVFGGLMIDAIQDFLRWPEWMLRLFGFLRWSIPIAGLVLISGFIYWIAPEPLEGRERERKSVWPGALTFVGVWILISIAFSLYVSNMGNYNKIYGPMGAIVILMIWLYLTSFALILGGEVNALYSEGSRPMVPSRV
jgi:membrane protein